MYIIWVVGFCDFDFEIKLQDFEVGDYVPYDGDTLGLGDDFMVLGVF